MPWTHEDYPIAWKNLPEPVRDKAVEIGNALLDDGMDEGRAIPIALSQARKAMGRQMPRDAWVIPYEDGWAMKLEGEDQVYSRHDTQREAIDHAVAYAREKHVTVTVQAGDGSIKSRQSFKERL